MGFQLPTFNLLCNIWRNFNINNPPPPPVQVQQCQLWLPRYALFVIPNHGTVNVMHLRLPAHTDIRYSSTAAQGDVVEVPAGSGRLYYVWGVDDVAKGFGNEYRVAYIYAATFSVPIG